MLFIKFFKPLILIGFIVSVSPNSFYSKEFKKDLTDGFKNVYTLKVSSAKSLMKCLVLCYRDLQCLTAVFDSQDYKCSFFDALAESHNILNAANKILLRKKVLQNNKDNCSNGLMYSNDAGKCIDCPNGWINNLSSCYYISSSSNNWFDAEAYCRSHNGTLLNMENPRKETIGISAMSSINSHVWIGGVSYYGTSFFWTRDNLTLKSTLWYQGEPNFGLSGGEPCVQMFFWEQTYLNDIACSYNYRFICEKIN